MFNRFAKALLVATALAPVLGAFGINALSHGKQWPELVGWFGTAIGLVVLSVLLLLFASKEGEVHTLAIKRIRSSDREILAFLLAYLLPLMAEDTLGFSGDTPTLIYVFALIFLAVYHSNAYHFNPLLGLCGYHFYDVETADDMSFLLITRHTIRQQSLTRDTVQITDYMFLDVGPKQ